MPSVLLNCPPTSEKDLTHLAIGEDLWNINISHSPNGFSRFLYGGKEWILNVETSEHCLPCMFFTNDVDEMFQHHRSVHTSMKQSYV